MYIKLRLAAAFGALLLAATWAAAQQPESSGPEDFTAAVIVNNELGSGAGRVQIRINRWSTDADRTRLVTILRENGPAALLKELRRLPSVGTIRTPDSIGYDLHYARQSPVGDGRRIVIATDRPIGFWEARNQPRTMDYPFTLIQMQLDREGKGKGTMSYATKIVANDDTIELEDFASSPMMLTQIEARKRNK
jgi:hypothetical protein